MPEETIVAVFDTAAYADAAVKDLVSAQVPASGIRREASTSETMSGQTAPPAREPGFWKSLFGGEPDHDIAVYNRSLDSGSTIVTVTVPETMASRVMDILERHNPVDIDERAAGYGLTQTQTTTTTALPMAAAGAPLDTAPMAGSVPLGGTSHNGGVATGDETIRLAEERLSVGKRAVNHGTTRIRRFVVETPVEEQVTLRTERVTLDRRPVTDGRPVADAAFTDKTIEMTETSEEAVVAKTAHVTEEISLRKEATERVETVRDTVRREDVEVEQVPGTKSVWDKGSFSPVPPATPKV